MLSSSVVGSLLIDTTAIATAAETGTRPPNGRSALEAFANAKRPPLRTSFSTRTRAGDAELEGASDAAATIT